MTDGVRLVLAQGPFQALTACATVRHLDASEGPRENVLVVGGLHAAGSDALARATVDCAVGASFASIHFAGADDTALRPDDTRVAEVLCARTWQRLNEEALAHFPDARRVLYGDGTGLLDSPPDPIAGRTEAHVVLPQPARAAALQDLPVTIVAVEHLRDAIKATRAAAPRLVEADAELAAFAAGGVLALLGNLTEARMTTLRGELRQTRALLDRVLRPGMPVVLKPHPRASLGQAEYHASALAAAGHQVRVLGAPEQGLYPIECFTTLVEAVGTVQGGLSSSAVSLPLLYGVACDVELPPRLARATLFPDVWNDALSAVERHRRAVATLPGWDGRTPMAVPRPIEPSRCELLAAAPLRRTLAWVPHEGPGASHRPAWRGLLGPLHRRRIG